MNEDELLTYLRRLNSGTMPAVITGRGSFRRLRVSVAGYEVKQSDLVMNQAAPAATLSTEVALLDTGNRYK